MFDIGWTELLVIGIVALIVVGPKDLPGMFRTLGRFTGKAKGMAREFQSAMNEAADQAGVKDVANDLKSATSKKGLGLDALDDVATKFENWDPMTPEAQKKAAETKASEKVKTTAATKKVAAAKAKTAASKTAAGKTAAAKTAASKTAAAKTAKPASKKATPKPKAKATTKPKVASKPKTTAKPKPATKPKPKATSTAKAPAKPRATKAKAGDKS